MTMDRFLVFLAVGAAVGLLASGRGHGLTRTKIERSTLGALGAIVGALVGAGFRAPGLPSAVTGACVGLLLLVTLSATNERLIRVHARRQPLE